MHEHASRTITTSVGSWTAVVHHSTKPGDADFAAFVGEVDEAAAEVDAVDEADAEVDVVDEAAAQVDAVDEASAQIDAVDEAAAQDEAAQYSQGVNVEIESWSFLTDQLKALYLQPVG